MKKVVDLKKEKWALLGIFAAMLGVYVFTMPRTVTFEDSGFFIMSSYFNGISHPPGYPLHSVLGKIFSYFPVGTVAFRINLMSAFFGALSCSLLYVVAKSLFNKGRLIPLTVAIAYGLSRVFWSQAIIAEVYTLNTFFTFLLMAGAIYFKESGNVKLLYALAFIFGLSLTNHYPLIGLSTIILLCFVWPQWRLIARKLPLVLLFGFLGLFPYLYMYFRSQDPDLIYSFHGPLNSFDEFWFFFRRHHYAELETSVSANISDKIRFTVFAFKELFRQMTLLGGVFGLIGFVLQWKRWPKHICWGLTLGFVASSFLLVGFLLDFDWDLQKKFLYRVYPIVPYGIMALWIGLFLEKLKDGLKDLFKSKEKWVLASACVVFIVGIFIDNYYYNNRRNDTAARDYAKAILDAMPEGGANYFTHGDVDAAPLGYMNMVEGHRSDVTLYNDSGMCFNQTALFHPVKSTSNEWNKIQSRKRIEELHRFIKASKLPVFHTDEIFPSPYGQVNYGVFRETKDTVPEGAKGFVVNKSLMAYFKQLVKTQPIDNWSQMHKSILIGKYADYLTNILSQVKDPLVKIELESLHEELNKYFVGKLRTASVLLAHGKDLERAWKLLQGAKLQMEEAYFIANKARVYEYMALVKFPNKKVEEEIAEEECAESISYLEKSLNIYPNPKNNSLPFLHGLLLDIGKKEEIEKLQVRFPSLKTRSSK